MIFESDIEKLTVELLVQQKYDYITPEQQEQFRSSLDNVIFLDNLRTAVTKLNPHIPLDKIEQVCQKLTAFNADELLFANQTAHKILTEGVNIEYSTKNGLRSEYVKLIDFNNPYNNKFIVTNQFTVINRNTRKRPDVVLLVNGIPIVVIELKNPNDEQATVYKAYAQLQTYKQAIPSLFHFNCFLIASDGLDAKVGSLSADFARFVAWRTQDGIVEDSSLVPQIETLVHGLLNPSVLLDMIRHFTVFETTKTTDIKTGLPNIRIIKKIAAYHQYYAVNKALSSTITATNGNHKAGVIWHTQGSGKSLSMVFYSGKVILSPELKNPTIVILTDRNDLDDQLFETFSNCLDILRQTPIQANSSAHLKDLLRVAGGGVIFTTIQKFSPDIDANFECLSTRDNIVVVADEAHRSQYGFKAKYRDTGTGMEVSYGFAKYLRDALPNASFIGFTGTPIDSNDISTKAVFGEYVDVYDIARAVEDGATVKIYYESRLVKLKLNEDVINEIDDEIDLISETDESIAIANKSKAKWARMESIIGHPERLITIANDIVNHFEARQQVLNGKVMIVCMSRRIAVALYDEIIKLRSNWHSEDKTRGKIKVVMTSNSSDPLEWQIHKTTKDERKYLGERFKDIDDELEIVIVRDMWLTGFDVPSMHTMYIDKPMQGHNLMQAIARVNRVFADKPGGLIVDYIGIANNLKQALQTYTQSGGNGSPTENQVDAISLMFEKLEIVRNIVHDFDYSSYFAVSTHEKLKIILNFCEFILSKPKVREEFIKQVMLLSRRFALSMPSEQAIQVRDEVAFFEAIKARLNKFADSVNNNRYELNSAIKQLIDKAIIADKVVDVFDAAGIKKPEVSILSDDFLDELKALEHKNLALELLKKLLSDEIKTREKKNIIQSKKLSEMLQLTVNRYQSNLITAAQVIEELINLAKNIRSNDKIAEELGLSEYELAFYDALANSDNARDVLGHDKLRELAIILVKKVKENASIDWTIKESVRAKLKIIVKRTLRQFGYPPDMELLATENVLKQAEILADELTD